jgi:uncharacterized protein
MTFNHRRRWYLALFAIGLFLLMAKAYYDTNTIEVRRYTIQGSPLGEVLSGLNVALLSDLHIRELGLREKKLLQILDREKPDVILLAGDLIAFKGSLAPVLSFFEQLRPPLGIFTVLGNTEYSNENGSCILCHQDKSKDLKQAINLIVLRNSSSLLTVDGKVVTLAGIDDPVTERADLNKTLGGGNYTNPSILLAHSPSVFQVATEHGIDLLLCGHNHGGQLFLTKFMRALLPQNPDINFLQGFFQKGKTLMYVSRGIGTSFLPFRFGVRPEITFFSFEKARDSSTLTEQLAIRNNPPVAVFAGLSFANAVDTFNILKPFFKSSIPENSSHSNILFDFESEAELNKLDWQCHKWFEVSHENVTSGKHSLKVSLPPGQYPGINFEQIRRDWSEINCLKMNIFNPSGENMRFHVRIDDEASGWEYTDRFDINFDLRPGMNQIEIPADSIKTNLHAHPLNLKKIRRMMVFIPNNTKQRELFIDNIRLE